MARICGVSRSAIWYRVQRGHLRPDKNGLLDVSKAMQALKTEMARLLEQDTRIRVKLLGFGGKVATQLIKVQGMCTEPTKRVRHAARLKP